MADQVRVTRGLYSGFVNSAILVKYMGSTSTQPTYLVKISLTIVPHCVIWYSPVFSFFEEVRMLLKTVLARATACCFYNYIIHTGNLGNRAADQSRL